MTGSRLNLVRWLKFNAVGAIGICVQLAVLATFAQAWDGTIYSRPHSPSKSRSFTTSCGTSALRGRTGSQTRVREDSPAFTFSNGAISLLGNLGIMKLLAGVSV